MILNLTQHAASPEQKRAGVVDLPAEKQAHLRLLLTFDAVPSIEEMQDRAEVIASELASGAERQAMIGGAPFFMRHLEDALHSWGIQPVYAFSRRESVEEVQTDGSVTKRNVFRHAGFVEA